MIVGKGLIKISHNHNNNNNNIKYSSAYNNIMQSYFYCRSNAWRQKIAILIRMQFLNHIIKSEHGFKTTQKFYKFGVLIKTLNFRKFLSSFKAIF